MSQIGWKSELSLLDEYSGNKPRYPLSTKIEYQAYEFNIQNELLKTLSYNQQQELKDTTSAVCGSLQSGFSELYDINTKGFKSIVSILENATDEISTKFNEVNRNLEQINATLSWGFYEMIEQLTLTNKKLDKLIQLLNIPDSQKQRKYHLEQGFDFLKKSKINSFFYSNAKQHFENAIKIEDTDYLSLQQLGMIHLYSKDLLDLSLAEKYFKKSILYSESDIDFARNQQNPSSFHFTYNPSKITSISLLHLARNYFIRKDYEMAFKTAERSIRIYEMVGTYFDLSKYACVLNQNKRTLFFLNKAISMDRYISIKALNEKLLIKHNYVQSFLKGLRNTVTSKALKDLKDLKRTAHQNSHLMNEVNNVEILVNKNTYIDSLKALEKIGYKLDN